MKHIKKRTTKKADTEFEDLDAYAKSISLETLRPLTIENRRKWDSARKGGRPRKSASERAVAVQVTLAPKLLEEIDAYADRTGKSRSELIAEGLRKVLPRARKRAS